MHRDLGEDIDDLERRMEKLEAAVIILQKELESINRTVQRSITTDDMIIRALELMTDKVEYLWKTRPRNP